MQQLLNTALGGLTLGMVYAAFALALVLIWRSTRIVNFAQAPMAMITTFVALVVIDEGYSYWVGFAAALATGLLLGAVLERVVIRPVEGKSEINAVILTLGLFIVIHALAAVIFGNQFRSFPAPFGIRGFEIGDVTIGLTGFGVFKIVSVLVVMALLVALFRYTDVGLRMRASAYNQEVARLLGVKVGRMLTLGWALAAFVGSLSGLLIAGGSLVHPALHGLGRGVRLRRRRAGRARQPRRRGHRRAAARPLAELRERLRRLPAGAARRARDPDAGAHPASRVACSRAPRNGGSDEGPRPAPVVGVHPGPPPAGGGARHRGRHRGAHRRQRLPQRAARRDGLPRHGGRRADRADRAQRADLARPRRPDGVRRLHDRAAAARPRRLHPAGAGRARGRRGDPGGRLGHRRRRGPAARALPGRRDARAGRGGARHRPLLQGDAGRRAGPPGGPAGDARPGPSTSATTSPAPTRAAASSSRTSPGWC